VTVPTPYPDAIEKLAAMRPFSDRERRVMGLAADVAFEFNADVPDATPVAWMNRVAEVLKALSKPEAKV
jgi:hypothetical protein